MGTTIQGGYRHLDPRVRTECDRSADPRSCLEAYVAAADPRISEQMKMASTAVVGGGITAWQAGLLSYLETGAIPRTIPWLRAAMTEAEEAARLQRQKLLNLVAKAKNEALRHNRGVWQNLISDTDTTRHMSDVMDRAAKVLGEQLRAAEKAASGTPKGG